MASRFPYDSRPTNLRQRQDWAQPEPRRDRDSFDERKTIPGYQNRHEGRFGEYGPERHGWYEPPFGMRSYQSPNEHDFHHSESADLFDRTYGSHLGQAIDDRDRFEPRYAERHHESLGHRIGEFVKRTLRPFRGPKGYTRSDERIREEVCEALSYLAEADVSDVEVSVAGGEVTLSGTIPRRDWKHRMEDAAEGVPGVKDVINNVRVKSAEARAAGDSSSSMPNTAKRSVTTGRDYSQS